MKHPQDLPAATYGHPEVVQWVQDLKISYFPLPRQPAPYGRDLTSPPGQLRSQALGIEAAEAGFGQIGVAENEVEVFYWSRNLIGSGII
ncbi:hypothetical protein GCM10022408_37640 [Hymenobacter fastidiosus]|uniref:Uncharacterized protein n=1 Tax=Hymenobacter fastidiosus TaxID=486264 RepID=A0ABP7T252_9BACT